MGSSSGPESEAEPAQTGVVVVTRASSHQVALCAADAVDFVYGPIKAHQGAFPRALSAAPPEEGMAALRGGGPGQHHRPIL